MPCHSARVDASSHFRSSSVSPDFSEIVQATTRHGQHVICQRGGICRNFDKPETFQLKRIFRRGSKYPHVRYLGPKVPVYRTLKDSLYSISPGCTLWVCYPDTLATYATNWTSQTPGQEEPQSP